MWWTRRAAVGSGGAPVVSASTSTKRQRVSDRELQSVMDAAETGGDVWVGVHELLQVCDSTFRMRVRLEQLPVSGGRPFKLQCRCRLNAHSASARWLWDGRRFVPRQ
jgi:hypothetical protein